jgi:hypothetical protein
VAANSPPLTIEEHHRIAHRQAQDALGVVCHGVRQGNFTIGNKPLGAEEARIHHAIIAKTTSLNGIETQPASAIPAYPALQPTRARP